MQKKIIIIVFGLLLQAQQTCHCQVSDTSLTPINIPRVATITTGIAAGWTGSILGLKYVWYSNFEKSKFHFFNDAVEWRYMDKLGHVTSAWNISRTTGDLYQWAGVSKKTSAWIGGGFGLAYLTTFEMLDAYSKKWGFSWADMLANTSGSLLYTLQELSWGDQKIKLKFSAANSGLAHHRPNVLGNDFLSRTFKDYNGQTYWVTGHPFNLLQQKVKVPKWITLAIGYSIQDQLFGDGETLVIYDGSTQQTFTPYSQFYLSLDVDLEKIPVQSKWLKVVLRGLNIIKFPLPAVEFSTHGMKFHALYF